MSNLAHSKTPVVPEVGPEVEAFVKEHALEVPYRHMLAKTAELFLTARSIRVLIEPDRDTPGHFFFTYEVRVPRADVIDRRAAKRRWGMSSGK